MPSLPMNLGLAAALAASAPCDINDAHGASQKTAAIGRRKEEHNLRESDAITERATAFVRVRYHRRTKVLAADVGVSRWQAARLLSGECWRIWHLERARRLWDGFNAFVFSMDDVQAHLGRFDAEIAELRRRHEKIKTK